MHLNIKCFYIVNQLKVVLGMTSKVVIVKLKKLLQMIIFNWLIM